VIDVELRGAAVANGGLRTTRLVGPGVEFQRRNKTQIVGATIGFGLRRNFGDAGTGSEAAPIAAPNCNQVTDPVSSTN
jgi:hypothetical protein